MNLTTLLGKNCLITGASRGIGKEIAFMLANSGCNLLITATNRRLLDDVRNELNDLYPNIIVHSKEADLSNSKDIKKLIDFTKKNFTSIDILINNAGIFSTESICDIEEDQLELIFSVNVKAPFLLVKEFSKGMMSNKWGRIVNVGSTSAYEGFPNTSMYCSSKHALLGLSRSLNKEMKSHGVRTYFVAPGSVKTKMGEDIFNQDYSQYIDPKEVAEIIRNIISYDTNFVVDEIRLSRLVVNT